MDVVLFVFFRTQMMQSSFEACGAGPFLVVVFCSSSPMLVVMTVCGFSFRLLVMFCFIPLVSLFATGVNLRGAAHGRVSTGQGSGAVPTGIEDWISASFLRLSRVGQHTR